MTGGSSPLARGLLLQELHPASQRRIIPARAGFTGLDGSITADDADHPRSRGVYQTCGRGRVRVRGSSPLARGLPPKTRGRVFDRGIIPARAGFTPLSAPLEHSAHGSSPLARGLPLSFQLWRMLIGIIPARAGFTPTTTPRGTRVTDHPRSRGVYVGLISRPHLHPGSSPLARGLPQGWP